MKFNEQYSYDTPRFAPLRDIMRDLISAWGNAEKWFAALKEWPRVRGMPNLSDAIHRLEHIQPQRLDMWADAYRAWLLPLEYPATAELDEGIPDMDKLFEVCVQIVDEMDAALMKAIAATKGGEFNALSLATENLQVENARDRIDLLTMWAMWDNGVSAAEFDNFVREMGGGS